MKEIDVAAASDALARLDEGEGREGDEQLAADLEGFLQYRWALYWDAVDRAEQERLAALCGGCVPGGTGAPCEDHDDDLDALWQAIGDSR